MTVLLGKSQRLPQVNLKSEMEANVSAIKKEGKGKRKGDAKSVLSPISQSVRDAKGNIRDPTTGETSSAWTWNTLADASSSDRSTIFTVDGNYFFSIVGMSIRVYSAETGEILSTLSSTSAKGLSSRMPKSEGHSDVITAIVINPENPFQLLSASLDGTIKIWDYLDASLIQTIHVGRPISQMCVHEKFKGHAFVAVLTKPGNGQASLYKGNTLVYRVSLKPRDRNGKKSKFSKSSEIVKVGKSRAAVAMSISPSGSWLVVVAGHKAYVSMTSSLESGFTKFVSPEKLTCLAFHPVDDYFATGDVQGQIRLWYCLNSLLSFSALGGEKRAQTTVMHWHAHAVSSLAFTPNGAYLLSGGEESVLVIWQLQSGKREYVPRLGSPLLHVSVRRSSTAEEYLIGLSDGTYVFVDASSLSVSRTISRMKLDPSGTKLSSNGRVPLAAHRRSSTLILPAPHPSSLQIYSPATSSLITELEVSPSNRVSRRDEKAIEASRVEIAVVSASGEWLATVDLRNNDEEFSEEVYLKIWRWESKRWILNTRIDRPHGWKTIVALSFRPVHGEQGDLLMTAGSDGLLKTWSTRFISNKDERSEVFWISRSSFSFRDMSPVDACWSPDGSLLAVCFEQQVVLYDPLTNLPLDCLVTPDARHVSSLSFVGSSGRYLFVAGKNNAVLWDLVGRMVAWRYNSHLEISCVLAHPTDEVFAMIVHPFAEGDAARTTKVILFHPQSSVPTEIQTLPFRFRAVSWHGDDKDSCTLLGITDTWSIVLCGDKPIVQSAVEEVARELTNGVALPTRTLFQDIFGQEAFVDTTTLTRGTTSLTPATRLMDRVGRAPAMFDTPAYLAPPLESLYSSIMNNFMRLVTEQKDVSKEQVVEEEEVMVVDEDEAPPRTERRVVDDIEIESLTTLFKTQTIAILPESGARTNGIVNGDFKMLDIPYSTDTKSTRTSTPIRQNGISANAVQNASTSPVRSHPSPAITGKKRKKNLV